MYRQTNLEFLLHKVHFMPLIIIYQLMIVRKIIAIITRCIRTYMVWLNAELLSVTIVKSMLMTVL